LATTSTSNSANVLWETLHCLKYPTPKAKESRKSGPFELRNRADEGGNKQQQNVPRRPASRKHFTACRYISGLTITARNTAIIVGLFVDTMCKNHKNLCT